MFCGLLHDPPISPNASPFLVTPYKMIWFHLLLGQALVVMVAPFAPHLGEECWQLLGNNEGEGITYTPWVEWREELCVSETVTLGVQVRAIGGALLLCPVCTEHS